MEYLLAILTDLTPLMVHANLTQLLEALETLSEQLRAFRGS